MAEFDKDYWEGQWASFASRRDHRRSVNPYVPTETANLPRGTAMDAGCGDGAEALWLAEQGWEVTAADISRNALAKARASAANVQVTGTIDWLEADLSLWEPKQRWDLVVTSYAHAVIGQLRFYQRIASWVAPGGTLLIVGHLHDNRHQHEHPHRATVTLEAITGLLRHPKWSIEAAYENTRTPGTGSSPAELRDVIVRAQRFG